MDIRSKAATAVETRRLRGRALRPPQEWTDKRVALSRESGSRYASRSRPLAIDPRRRVQAPARRRLASDPMV